MSRAAVVVLFLASALVGCASVPANSVPPASSAPPADTLIAWNAGAGTIRCRSTTLEIPVPLRAFVRQTAPNEVTIVPSWSPPGGALVVTLLGAGHRTDATSFLQDLPTTWTRLHRLADIGDFNSANARANVTWEMGRLVAEYALEPGSGLRGKLVYLQSARCRIAALDLVGSSTNPGLTELLDGLDSDLDLVAQTPFLPGS